MLLIVQLTWCDILLDNFFDTSGWNAKRCPRKVWPDRGWEVLVVTEMWWWEIDSFLMDIIPFVFWGFIDSLTSSLSVSLHRACAGLQHAGIVYLIIILTGNSNPNFKLLGPDIFNSLFSLHLIPKWDPRAEFSLVVLQMKSFLSMLGLKSQFITELSSWFSVSSFFPPLDCPHFSFKLWFALYSQVLWL